MTQPGIGPGAPDGGGDGLARIAAGLAAAAIVAVVVLAAADADGPIWFIQGALSAAAAIVGWRAGGTSLRKPVALGAVVVGTVLFLMFLGFAIAEA